MNIFDSNTLYLKDVLFKELPYNFHLFGSLDLTGSSVTELPEGLKIGKNLIIGDAPIKELPKRFYVGGDLDITSAIYINSIPKGAVIGGTIKGAPDGYVPKKYNKNTISDHAVCCDCGTVIIFSKWDMVAARYDHYGNVIARVPFYYGIDNKIFAFEYEKKYYLCKDNKDAEKQYNYLERDKRAKGLGYENFTFDQEFTFEEIYQIYKILTDTCDEAIPEFKRIISMLGLDGKEKLTLRVWIDGSKYSSYKYNYLFVDFFEKNIENNKTEEVHSTRLSITDIIS
jgi:hypothetical protein